MKTQLEHAQDFYLVLKRHLENISEENSRNDLIKQIVVTYIKDKHKENISDDRYNEALLQITTSCDSDYVDKINRLLVHCYYNYLPDIKREQYTHARLDLTGSETLRQESQFILGLRGTIQHCMRELFAILDEQILNI
jgi:hypothetical protein